MTPRRQLLLNLLVVFWGAFGVGVGRAKARRREVLALAGVGLVFAGFGCYSLLDGYVLVGWLLTLFGLVHLVAVAIYPWPRR